VIAKKVKCKGGRSKAARISNLINYITDDKDKVDYHGSRGFLCDDLNSQIEETIALATDAPKSTNPLTHWVISWHKDERPNRQQVEEAIDILLDELKMTDRQVIYAAHKDTDNYHLHIAINRVNPDTLKVPNNFRDVELAHKAIARIQNLQGWQPEERARYQIVNGQTQRLQHPPQTTKQPAGQIAQQIESHQGIKSAERIAIEKGANLIRVAHTWEDLHESLAEEGMRYEQYGTGAYLYVGEVKLKASSAGRDCSLPQVQKRLGEYQQPPTNLNIQDTKPELMDNLSPEQREYFHQKLKYNERQKISTTPVKDRHVEQSQNLKVEQKSRREEIMGGDWQGKGDLLNALRAVVAEDQEGEREELRERQREEMDKLKVQPFPEFENWKGLRVREEQKLEVEQRGDYGMSR
jgi:Relaxase/Mobilisation nuclease domain